MLLFFNFQNFALKVILVFCSVCNYIYICIVDFLDSCRASTLLAELDDDEDLPEPDEEDDENEDDNQEDQEYEEVMVQYS